MLIGIIGFPLFYFLYCKTEIWWIDALFTFICVFTLVCHALLIFDSRVLALIWFITLIILLPFNYTFNLLLNPGHIAYQLGEMITLLISVSLIGDILLLLIFFLFGILAAILVFFLYANTVIIPYDIYQILPLYLLGVALGGALISNRNYSYRKERLKAKTITQAKDNLADISRKDSVKEAVAAVAHEITQPLSAVINYTNGCRHILHNNFDGKLPTKVTEALDKSCEQAQRAGDILHTLKDYFSDSVTKKELYDINQIIINVLDILDDVISQYKIQIILSLAPQSPSVYCDKLQIEMVFINLIKNAIEAVTASDKEEKKIIIQTQTLSLSKIKFSIKDTGIGIAKNNLSKIFFPFMSTKKTGIGIGLALCEKIIQQHHGQIQVSSEKNIQTEISIILPSKQS